MDETPGVTLITVNNRLARVLVAAHEQDMMARGAPAWETLHALPFDAFVAEQWSAMRERAREPLPRLLAARESRALWQQVVAASDGEALLAPAAAAASAADARERLFRYQSSLTLAECGDSPDALAFHRWHETYRQRLDDERWIDTPAAANRLAALLREGVPGLPRRVRLVGFDAVTPQQEALVAALGAAGVAVEPPTPAADAAAPLRTRFESPDAELEGVARWARQLLDAGEAGLIGVVIPDLASRVDAVRASFEDAMHPASTVTPSPPAGSRVFNVSLGRPLVRVPVVADALAAIETALGQPEAEVAGRSLLSPYLAGAGEEAAARLALEARLRDQGVRRIRTRHLARLAARGGATGYARRLEQAASALPHPRARQDLSLHARTFAGVLTTLGWAGGRSLESAEFQAAESLRGVLEAFGGLSAVSRPCTTSAALAMLSRELTDTTFQPRAAAAPVQVLGVLEAAGLQFRHLWLAGFHDGVWPPPETPSPLLPMALQRRAGMPGASPEQSLARGRRLTARLLAAAPAPVVSHAEASGDQVQTASPLLGTGPVVPAAAIPHSSTPFPDAYLSAAAPALERLDDWRVRGVGHGWRARGGSRVLTDQAACPFRAFARHRLAATAIERAPAPLDARARGHLAHRMMQYLFQGIDGSEALDTLDDEAREALASQAAEAAVASVLRGHPGEVSRRLAQAERERLTAMALRWLASEGSRSAFQVESVEQRRSVRIGGLILDIQLDRVDRVDGQRLLLDYKTGRARRGDWFGDRPGEPQLPLYALALDADGGVSAPVGGVAFARLKRGEEGYEGVAEDAAWAPGLAALGSGSGAWKEFARMRDLKAYWAEVLGRLAEAFADGDARVDPLPAACRYCEVRPLCRVDAVLGRPPDGEDAS